MYPQQEYGLAWGLVFMVLLLAMVAVCIPRPRRLDYKPVDKRQAAKEKALRKKKKAQAKRNKIRAKKNKKQAKKR